MSVKMNGWTEETQIKYNRECKNKWNRTIVVNTGNETKVYDYDFVNRPYRYYVLLQRILVVYWGLELFRYVKLKPCRDRFSKKFLRNVFLFHFYLSYNTTTEHFFNSLWITCFPFFIKCTLLNENFAPFFFKKLYFAAF